MGTEKKNPTHVHIIYNINIFLLYRTTINDHDPQSKTQNILYEISC